MIDNECKNILDFVICFFIDIIPSNFGYCFVYVGLDLNF